jgi:hypothetical protein
VHVIEGLAEIVSEVLEQLLHVGNGEGKVAARVWERKRGVRGEREEGDRPEAILS